MEGKTNQLTFNKITSFLYLLMAIWLPISIWHTPMINNPLLNSLFGLAVGIVWLTLFFWTLKKARKLKGK
jgi:hypothetical protein